MHGHAWRPFPIVPTTRGSQMRKPPISSSTWRWRRSEPASRHLPLIPDDLFLEFEVTQSTATEGRFRRAIRKPIASRIVLGFSPLAPVDAPGLDAADPGGILATLRGRGVRIAVDETSGPGFAAFDTSPRFPRSSPGWTKRWFAPWARASRATPSSPRWPPARRTSGARLDRARVDLSRSSCTSCGTSASELVQGPIVGEPIPLSELDDHERRMWGISAGQATEPRGR